MIRFAGATFALFSLSSTAFAGFATDTITATPGFGSVIDSGPGKFSSALIDARMADLIDEATSEGCDAVSWAGTWVRGRTPRLQGLTDASGVIQGATLTNGTVSGVAFEASLASGGEVDGMTEGGNVFTGYFARLGSKRSIWYGVEISCSEPDPPIESLLAFYDFDGGTVDQVGNAPAIQLNGATLTTGGGGQSGIPGDESLDLGLAGNSAHGVIAAGTHFDELTTNDAAAISWWQFSTGTTNTSSFWFISPTVTSHALQAHATWGDGFFYFDHTGCCAIPATRTRFTPTIGLVGDWHHIVVQKSGDLRQVWIDNTLQANVGGGVALPPFTGQVFVGSSTSGGNGFGGRIDDFAVFSEALTPAQIAVLAAGGSPLDL